MVQTTEELLLGGKVQQADFSSFMKAYKIPDGAVALMLLEMLPCGIVEPENRQRLLLFEQFNPETDFALYTSGRIFHERGELRWERQQTDIQVVYTGESKYKPEPGACEEMALDTYDPKDRSYLLFGKRLAESQIMRIGPAAQEGDFAEVRISRLLRYPALEEVKDAERVQLTVCEYRDRTTGATIAYRFKQLVPFQKSHEQEQL